MVVMIDVAHPVRVGIGDGRREDDECDGRGGQDLGDSNHEVLRGDGAAEVKLLPI